MISLSTASASFYVKEAWLEYSPTIACKVFYTPNSSDFSDLILISYCFARILEGVPHD